MKQILISKFKAECIAILKEVQRSGEPVQVTLRGAPLSLIYPAYSANDEKRLGVQQGKMQIRCNLVQSDSSADWEMLKK